MLMHVQGAVGQRVKTQLSRESFPERSRRARRAMSINAELIDEADMLFPEAAWGEAGGLADEPLPGTGGCCGLWLAQSPPPSGGNAESLQIRMRALLIAADDSWSNDDHSWLAALMAGKESRVVGASRDTGYYTSDAGYRAYWAAAAVPLANAELGARFDVHVLAPCLEQIRSGSMAGFKCTAKCIGGRVGRSMSPNSLITSDMGARTAMQVIGDDLAQARNEALPHLNAIILVKVAPPPAQDAAASASRVSRRASATGVSGAMKFLTPSRYANAAEGLDVEKARNMRANERTRAPAHIAQRSTGALGPWTDGFDPCHSPCRRCVRSTVTSRSPKMACRLIAYCR